MAFFQLGKTPIKSITFAYIFALSLVAGISAGAHLVVEYVVNQTHYSAPTINIAGKQRMLSQRSAYLLVKANSTRSEADIKKLDETVKEFEQNHLGLVFGDMSKRLSGEYPDTVKSIYFDEASGLHEKVVSHINELKGFVAVIKAGEPLSVKDFQQHLNYSEDGLVRRLNDVVVAFELEADRKVGNLVWLQRMSVIAILIALTLEAIIIFNPLVKRIKKYAENLEFLASHDPLTKIYNRRSFLEYAEKEMSRSSRYSQTPSFLICDLDHFKAVNDTHGHNVGDTALRHFVALVQTALRSEDVFARIGGEEFVIMLPNTDSEGAVLVAERINELTRKHPVVLDETDLFVTVSIGITELDIENRSETVDDVMSRADEALYRAKDNGRDRFEIQHTVADLNQKVEEANSITADRDTKVMNAKKAV